MISYFDTSVLFPAMLHFHPRHRICLDILSDAQRRKEVICLSMHVYAELYSNLTRFPVGRRLHPSVAVESILDAGKDAHIVELLSADYEAAMRRCANAVLVSGVIYDALHLQAAIKAGAGRLYTANIKDFARLMTPEVSIELMGVNF